MSKVIGGILNVKADEVLEKAIAVEVTQMDDKDLGQSFIEQMALPYNQKSKKKVTVTEELGNEGQDTVIPEMKDV